MKKIKQIDNPDPYRSCMIIIMQEVRYGRDIRIS